MVDQIHARRAAAAAQSSSANSPVKEETLAIKNETPAAQVAPQASALPPAFIALETAYKPPSQSLRTTLAEAPKLEVPAELRTRSPDGSPSFGAQTPRSGFQTPRSRTSDEAAEAAEPAQNAMDVDTAPESSDNRNVFIESEHEAEEGSPDDASDHWPSNEEAKDLDRTFQAYGPYEAASHRQVGMSSPLSPVAENPAPALQDQDAASPSADDMEEDDEEDRWSRIS